MPTGNFRIAYQRQLGRPETIYRPNGKSTTIQMGHPVVMTTNATYTTASNPVVRSLIAGDVTAQYKESTPIAGLLGFALREAVTNSSGVASSQSVYSGKASAAEPILQAPSYGSTLPVDPTISYSMIAVAVALPGVVFRGKLGGGGTTTATNVLVGTLAGIDIASGVYTVDTSETYKPLVIVDWDRLNTSYVYFEVLPTYCQYLTGVSYSSQ